MLADIVIGVVIAIMAFNLLLLAFLFFRHGLFG
jgi:hypothetical protein